MPKAAVEYKVDVPDIALYKRKSIPVVVSVLDRGLEEGGALVVEKAVNNAPYGVTGNLRSTIKSRPILSPFGVAVAPFTDYASGVEKGTEPHVVPLDDLELWVRRKLQIDSGQSVGVAKAIQRSISKVGTKGQHFMQKTFEETEDAVTRIFERAGAEATRELGKP